MEIEPVRVSDALQGISTLSSTLRQSSILSNVIPTI
jgi:hypothetical protein